MTFSIDRTSELSVHQQLRQQIIFRISTGEIPIGQMMPSVRVLERQNKISRNTVGKVYAELVEQRWLTRQGSRLVAVRPRTISAVTYGGDVGTIIERLLTAARLEGLSTAQLLARINDRVAAPPPDHLLVVEPEPAMGEVLRYEVKKATGWKSVSYSVQELRRRPNLLDGAALLVPAYLADLLDFVPPKQRFAMVLLWYSPFGHFIESIQKLAKPSVLGMISVSGPGMKTMDGLFAEAIGSRHQFLMYCMELPIQRGNPVFHRVTSKELPPDIDVRLPTTSGRDGARDPSQTPQAPDRVPKATMEDLRAVDTLFCDSITYDAVKHPNRIKYQLLSEETLQELRSLKWCAKTEA